MVCPITQGDHNNHIDMIALDNSKLSELLPCQFGARFTGRWIVGGCYFAVIYGTEKRQKRTLHSTLSNLVTKLTTLVFTAQRRASMVYAMVMCLSVRLPVTSRCST